MNVDANPRGYDIIVSRGQAEELLVDDALLAGTAVVTTTQIGGPRKVPTDEHLREQMRRISDVFPTNSVDYRLRDLGGFNKAPTLLKVNKRLKTVRAMDKAWGDINPGIRSFAFLLDIGPSSTKTGMAWLKVSSTYGLWAEAPTAGGRSRSTGAHEGAHTWGRAHAVFLYRPPWGSIGLCGSKYNDLASPHHPFIEWTGIEHDLVHDIDDAWRFFWPTIGPLSEPDDEIWGFSPRAYANGVGFDHLVVIDPRLSAELMSYCDQGRGEQDRWVSSFSYEKLRQRLGSGNGESGSDGELGGEGDYMIIAGAIDDVTGEVEMEPALRVTGFDPGNDVGEVHVALVDSQGAEISAQDVALLVDGDHSSMSDGVGPEPGAFFAAVEIPAGITPAGIVVSLDGIEIAQVEGSANPPTVEIISPVGGSSASGSIPINWNFADVNGDLLTTTIVYSIDGGLTWETLAVDVEGTEYDAPTRFLRGSDQARIRVLVSDGFHTAEATSEIFSVDAGYPLASIESPINGAAVVTDGIVHLRGDGWDPEDGVLDGVQLVWASDVDGVLGTGTSMSIAAIELTSGCQWVSLTATDGDGQSDTREVEIDVGATGCLGREFSDGFESGDTSAWSATSP